MAPPVVNKQRSPRSDAAENRAQIIRTAAEMFAKEGPATSVEAIAKGAGLGIGTLYRHFPTKDALISAIVTTYIDRMTAMAESLLETAPSMEALRSIMERMIEEGTAKKDFVAAIGGYEKIACTSLDCTKQRFKAVMFAIIERAQAEGAMRNDVAPDDVMALINAVNMTDANIACRMRQLHVVLDGLAPR